MQNKFLISAISLSAVLAMFCDWHNLRLAFLILKPLTTILIIALLLQRVQQFDTRYLKLIFAGLIFCLAGDTLLMWDSLFVYGLSAFLIGHLLFLAAFSSLNGFSLIFRSLLPIATVTFAVFFWLLPKLGEISIPVAIYMVVLSTMVWQAINLYLKQANEFTQMLAIAALLFLFSDSIIAINKFKVPFELSGITILCSYWLSIGLIAYSAKLSTTFKGSNQT
jgi:uncharacterized membrane protein YhhN